MTTLEEFEAAPPGSTAKRAWKRAVKTFYSETDRNWLTRGGEWISARELVERDWTLDPPPAGPATAREALDLAWNLAHPIKIGQTIPDGTEYLRRWTNDATPATYPAHGQIEVDSEKHVARVRTLDPLPEPAPDWLDAPAVLANEPGTGKRGVFIPTDKDTGKHWAVVFSALSYHWSELENVIPLYPKERAGSVAPLYPKETDR